MQNYRFSIILILLILCSYSININIDDECKSYRDKLKICEADVRYYESCCQNTTNKITYLREHLQDITREWIDVNSYSEPFQAYNLWIIMEGIKNNIVNQESNHEKNLLLLKTAQKELEELSNYISSLKK